jgi:hypothetical protein
LLKARYTGVNVLEEMLMLIEAFGMYCVLDPIDGNVASCAIVKRNHFRESLNESVPSNQVQNEIPKHIHHDERWATCDGYSH